jgi:hypothetical protein
MEIENIKPFFRLQDDGFLSLRHPFFIFYIFDLTRLAHIQLELIFNQITTLLLYNPGWPIVACARQLDSTAIHSDAI